MEKVKVVKEIPGIIKLGDVLTSYTLGGDFILEEKVGNNERYVSLDYVTVCDNMPEFFEFELELVESSIDMSGKAKLCNGCFECTCGNTVTDVRRSDLEIEARREFFQRQLDMAVPGSESEVVFSNLIWFIEWLVGEKELLKF
jgi:hypothetical protein